MSASRRFEPAGSARGWAPRSAGRWAGRSWQGGTFATVRAVAILDGRSLLDTDGRFQIERAREEIGRRLHLAPRFRQLLYRPRFGLGWPLWVDAASIDIAEHIRVRPL